MKPLVWFRFTCQRCGVDYRAVTITRNCPTCIGASAIEGVTGIEHIGEASGA